MTILSKNEGRQTGGCYLCGGTPYDVIFRFEEPDRFELAAAVEAQDFFREWRRCISCGLVYTRRSYRGLESLYADKYRSNEIDGEGLREKGRRILAMEPATSDAAMRARRLKEALGWIRKEFRCIGQGRRKQRILDVGAGLGVFLAKFLDEAWQGLAVDADREACAFVEEELGIPSVCDYYTRALIDERFDLVTLVNVLEHMEDPVAFMQICLTNMEPDGLCFVVMPDALNVDIYERERSTFNSPHVMLFDPATLAVVLTRAGLVTLEIRRIEEPSGALSITALCARQDALNQWKHNIRGPDLREIEKA